MAKTYKFKPEFEKKLKGVKRKFITNINNLLPKEIEDSLIVFQFCDNTLDFNSCVSIAFVWSSSPEGIDYWKAISER